MASRRSPPSGKGSEAQGSGDANGAQRVGFREAVKTELQCPTCYSTLLAARVLIPCGHVYCSRCISGWLRDESTCPMCRVEVMGTPQRCLALDRISDLLALDPVNLEDSEEHAEREGQSRNAAAMLRQQWEMGIQQPNGPAHNYRFSDVGLEQPLPLSRRSLLPLAIQNQLNQTAIGAAIEALRRRAVELLSQQAHGLDITGFYRGINLVCWAAWDPSILAAPSFSPSNSLALLASLSGRSLLPVAIQNRPNQAADGVAIEARRRRPAELQSRPAHVPYTPEFHRGNIVAYWASQEASISAALEGLGRRRHLPLTETHAATLQPVNDSAGPSVGGSDLGNIIPHWAARDPSILAVVDAITRRPHALPAQTHEATFQPLSNSGGQARGGLVRVQTSHGVSLVPREALPTADAIQRVEGTSRSLLLPYHTARSTEDLYNSFVRTPPATQDSRIITSDQLDSESVETPPTVPTPLDPPESRQFPSGGDMGGGP